MEDNGNKSLYEDGWNDGSNYDRIQDLLRNVDSTKEEAKEAIGISNNQQKRKFVSRRSSRFQKSRKVGSKSSSTKHPINHPITTVPNNDGNSLIREESKNLFKENDKEVQNILSEVVTKRSKSTYRVHNVTFIFWLFDTNIYRDKCLDEEFVGELKKAVNEDLIYDEKEKNRKGNRKRKSGLRKHQRKVCNDWLDALDNENTKRYPINLASLTFETFSRYISTRKT